MMKGDSKDMQKRRARIREMLARKSQLDALAEEWASDHRARLDQLQDQAMTDALVQIGEGRNAIATIEAWESIQWERIRLDETCR